MAGLDLETARTIVRGVFAAGAKAGQRPLTVAVADAGGHLMVLERADGANPGGCEIARNKAYGAVMMNIGGTRMRTLSQDTAWFLPAAQEVCGGRIFPVPGAVLVRDDSGRVVGAVGVTGDTPENDAAFASAGIEACGFAPEI